MKLLPVEEALSRILVGVEPVAAEEIALAHAGRRILAAPLRARRTQPAFAGSAMDGYAFRSADAKAGVRLRLAGESVAGRRYSAPLANGEAVRIFTGAPLPEGADTVLPQEQAIVEDGVLKLTEPVERGRYVRDAGIDFAEGEIVLEEGRQLGPRELALAASANHASISVRCRPRVAVLSIGDELVLPGGEPGPDDTIAVNAIAIAELARIAGAETIDLGVIVDEAERVTDAVSAASLQADVLVTIGGASVGDRDVTKAGLAQAGMTLDFWRIAMRPGKPLVFGKAGGMAVLGLPGNPVSSFVCGLIFLRPLIGALLGKPRRDDREPAILGADLPANGERESYLRATLTWPDDGLPVVHPMRNQDSSLVSVLAKADCLLVRSAHAKAEAAGAQCRIIRF